MISPDYQLFDLVDGRPENIGPRMQKKLHALRNVLPEDLSGKSVLDVGCDFGFWSFLSAQRGAYTVLGLDRGREVKGSGYVDLPEFNNERASGTVCSFEKTNLGKEWQYFGKHDVVLLMSLYHHIYHQAGDHLPIWYWLWRHTNETLIWENPTGAGDVVVQRNVAPHLHPTYTKGRILEAAAEYFNFKYIGPAEHEPTREVYLFTPRIRQTRGYVGKAVSGAGGASKAFLHNDGQRIKEIQGILGIKCFPGSLNVRLEAPFDWDRDYFRGKVSDVAERGKGLDVKWVERWARFYPVMIGGIRAFAFRFETDTYPPNFIELVSDKRLRDSVDGSIVVQCL